MVDFLKVRENQDLVRSKESKAILNINDKSLAKYKEEREERLKLNRVISETENLKSDISEIKYLLRELLGQNK
jgi:hypothetical protein